jgi:hypothetical protein
LSGIRRAISWCHADCLTNFALQVWWRGFKFIRRAIYSLPAGYRNIIRVLSGIQRAIYRLPRGRRGVSRIVSGIRRGIYSLRSGSRNSIRVLTGDSSLIYRLPAWGRNIIRVLSGIRCATFRFPARPRDTVPVVSGERRPIYRLPAGRRNVFRFLSGRASSILPARRRTIARLRIKQRPQSCVRLARGVYPMRHVRPLNVAQVRRVPRPIRYLPRRCLRLE